MLKCENLRTPKFRSHSPRAQSKVLCYPSCLLSHTGHDLYDTSLVAVYIALCVRLARRYLVAEVTYFRVQCFPARCNQEKLIVDDDVYPICVPGQHEAIDPNLQNLLVNDT